MKPITTVNHKRLVLSQLSDIQKRADKGVHTHSDYATLVRVITKLVKTINIEEEE